MTLIGRALAASHGYTTAEWDDPENASMRTDHLYDAESVVKAVQPLLEDAHGRGVLAGTDLLLAEVADFFMHRDGPGYVVDAICQRRETGTWPSLPGATS